METTNNYGLRKPDSKDFYDVADHNHNMDAIDTALKEHADAIDAVQSGVEANTNAIRNVEANVVSPTEIRDMIVSTPVANAVYAGSAGSANTAVTATTADRAIKANDADTVGGYYAADLLRMEDYFRYIDALKSDQDNRYINTTPNDYNSVFKIMGLKDNGTIGLPGTGVNYSHVFGMRGWHDYTGGAAHEFALCQNGLIYHRFGETDTWSNWELIMGSNFTRPVIVSATAPADTSAVWIVPS